MHMVSKMNPHKASVQNMSKTNYAKSLCSQNNTSHHVAGTDIDNLHAFFTLRKNLYQLLRIQLIWIQPLTTWFQPLHVLLCINQCTQIVIMAVIAICDLKRIVSSVFPLQCSLSHGGQQHSCRNIIFLIEKGFGLLVWPISKQPKGLSCQSCY